MTEFGRRVDGPCGRRAEAREPVLLSASLLGLRSWRPIILSDVSRSGAQLCGHEPMREGQEVWIKVPPAEIFGEVVWTDGDRCGITFDEPLTDDELGLLQALGSVIIARNLPPEELMALEDWRSGLAR